MSYIKLHVKSAPPLSTLGKPKDLSMNVSQNIAEMLSNKIKRNHVGYTSANLDIPQKISKPLPLKKCLEKINQSFGKNGSHFGSINTRQLSTEQTPDANCILYLNTFYFLTFFQQHANCNFLFLMTTSFYSNESKQIFHTLKIKTTCVFPFPKLIIISLYSNNSKQIF